MFTRITIFLTLFISCAKRPHDYQGGLSEFSKEYNLNLGSTERKNYFAQSKEVNDRETINRNELSLYIDLDKDGVADYNDPDIDGDGIHNYVDSHPLDSQIGDADNNANGIIDFIERESLLNLQKRLNAHGIIFVDLSERANSKVLEKIIFEKNLLKEIKGVSVINFNPMDLTKRGDFNKDWLTINIYPLAGKDYTETLVHESFHFYRLKNPTHYKNVVEILGWHLFTNEFGMSEYQFVGNADSLPSEYAKTSSDEAYAETMMYFWGKYNSLSFKRFENQKLFRREESYRALSDIISEQFY